MLSSQACAASPSVKYLSEVLYFFFLYFLIRVTNETIEMRPKILSRICSHLNGLVLYMCVKLKQ